VEGEGEVSEAFELTDPPTEDEIAAVIKYVENIYAAGIIRKLAFERDRLKEALVEISRHSVCCDARHLAEKALAGQKWEPLES
jgi:hypothetical protein